MSADGRSLIGNELSHHPKGTCLLLCYLELYAFDVDWHTCSCTLSRHDAMYEDEEADLEEGVQTWALINIIKSVPGPPL